MNGPSTQEQPEAQGPKPGHISFPVTFSQDPKLYAFLNDVFNHVAISPSSQAYDPDRPVSVSLLNDHWERMAALRKLAAMSGVELPLFSVPSESFTSTLIRRQLEQSGKIKKVLGFQWPPEKTVQEWVSHEFNARLIKSQREIQDGIERYAAQVQPTIAENWEKWKAGAGRLREQDEKRRKPQECSALIFAPIDPAHYNAHTKHAQRFYEVYFNDVRALVSIRENEAIICFDQDEERARDYFFRPGKLYEGISELDGVRLELNEHDKSFSLMQTKEGALKMIPDHIDMHAIAGWVSPDIKDLHSVQSNTNRANLRRRKRPDTKLP